MPRARVNKIVDPFRERAGATSAFGLLANSVKTAAKVAWRDLRRNWLTRPSFVPRVARFALYRLAGLHIETPNIFAHCYIEDVELHIGTGTFVNRGVYFQGAGTVSIGRDCLIGPECAFLTARHEHSTTGLTRFATNESIVVGERVLLGARVLLLPGAIIEDDVVVGAGAVVNGNCLAGGFYAGVPARRME